MRIAICTDQYLPMLSGIADSVAILATQLRTNGHEVRIYTLSLPDAVPDDYVMRFPSYVLPGSGGGMVLVLPVGAMRDLRAFKPDVIHTHLAGIVGFFALYASRRLTVPLVGTDHTFPADYLHYMKLDYRPFRWAVRKFSAWYYNRCVFVTAPSQNMLKELTDYGFSKPMQVVSNHIPSDLFRPLANKEELKKKYGIGKKAVLIFGRIATEKNLDFALEVYEQAAHHSDAELMFVGDGPYRAALEKKVADKGFATRVKFLGALRGEALVEAINACDIFLITSKSETQSMTTLQAMACGLPVVAIRAGGLPEYVADGEAGFVVDPHNKAEFVKRLLELLGDEALAKQMGEAGRISVQKFSPEAITKQFELIYQRFIAN